MHGLALAYRSSPNNTCDCNESNVIAPGSRAFPNSICSADGRVRKGHRIFPPVRFPQILIASGQAVIAAGRSSPTPRPVSSSEDLYISGSEVALIPDGFDLSQENACGLAVRASGEDIVLRLSRASGIHKNDVPFCEQGFHRVIVHFQGNGACPRPVCRLEHRCGVHLARTSCP